MATTYFGTKPVSDWTANGDAASGHNFIDQINNQQRDIDAGKAEYNNQKGNVSNAQSEYENAYKNQTGYSDLYNQAKDSEGVSQARDQYQRSLNAVNATNSAMNNLPSSINAGSNVVLNSSQRNAALGNQMGKYQNTLAYWQNQNAGDQSMYQTALGAAQDLAGKIMAQEQAKVSQAQNNYKMQMEQLNQLYQNVLNEKNIMRQIYGDMYDDEYNHMQQQIEIWAKNLDAETARYAEEQANYRQKLQADADRYAADAGMRLQQYMEQQNANKLKNWDFGNGYQLQDTGNGAAYYRNGTPISAGQFLEATGANGANWNLWNDVWNNGVSTQGVGSDTVNAFNRVSPANEKYNYLFGM